MEQKDIFGAGNINPVSPFLRHSLGVSTEGARYLLNALTVLSLEISEDVHLATVSALSTGNSVRHTLFLLEIQ